MTNTAVRYALDPHNLDVRVTEVGSGTWHGFYRIGGKWFTVQNAANNPIAYASEDAAFAGAKWMLDRERAKPVPDPVPAAAEPPPIPGHAVRIIYLKRGDELGDIRIQWMDAGSYRVGTFLPGNTVSNPGDTSKTEPEKNEWVGSRSAADEIFDRYVAEARAEGWTDYDRNAGAAPVKPKRAKRVRPKSKTQRWADAAGEAASALSEIEDALGRFTDAMADLRGVQEEYEGAKDNMPENLQSSAYGEKLQAVVDLEIENAADTIQSAIDTVREVVDEAEGIDLPLGFGRD